MRKESPVIGVISDTHGLLRQEALSALEGCQHIVHAGDIGQQSILQDLARLAPVTAIKGNIDTQPWTASLPATAALEIGDARLYVLHNLHDLDLDPAVADINLVVSGHSHKPAQTAKSGVIYLNPGSAGPRRFRLPISLARIELARAAWKITFIDLESGRPFDI